VGAQRHPFHLALIAAVQADNKIAAVLQLVAAAVGAHAGAGELEAGAGAGERIDGEIGLSRQQTVDRPAVEIIEDGPVEAAVEPVHFGLGAAVQFLTQGGGCGRSQAAVGMTAVVKGAVAAVEPAREPRRTPGEFARIAGIGGDAGIRARRRIGPDQPFARGRSGVDQRPAVIPPRKDRERLILRPEQPRLLIAGTAFALDLTHAAVLAEHDHIGQLDAAAVRLQLGRRPSGRQRVGGQGDARRRKGALLGGREDGAEQGDEHGVSQSVS